MYPSFNARALGLDLTATEAIELAASAGFGGVDLPVRDLVDSGGDLHAVRGRMEELGLKGGAWPLPVAWRIEDDAGRFERELARLPRYAEAAARLGLERTGTWVLPETPGRPGPGVADSAYLASVAAFHVERLGAIARVLALHGIRLGLEAIGVASSRSGRGLPFVTRLAELKRHLQPLWSAEPNVGLVVDAFHLYAADDDPRPALAHAVRDVVWVHVADLPRSASPDRAAIQDQQRGLPGEHGAVDSARLLKWLAGAGYEGPVTVETMADCRTLAGLSPAEAAQRVAAALRSVWPGQDV
jgi:sugar phosphate isomerase/epimerase